MYKKRPAMLALLAMTAILVVLLACNLSANATKPTLVAAATSPPTRPASPTPQRATSTAAPTATMVPSPTSVTDEELLDIAESLTIKVYERVSPSVVHITSRVIAMDYFGGAYPREGTGSGFVIDKTGNIVTNNHVVESAESVEVTLLDGTRAEAEIVGTDPLNDLAVIRVDVDPSKLFPVDMSYTDELRVGQRAIAIGNPFGLDWTLTSGVVSSLGRPLQITSDRIIFDVIQTDAAINPGNSGGPLLNSRGQLIGVNVAIRAGAENIGFAIPLSTVLRIVPELIENGRYPHPWLGVAGYPVFPELAQGLDLPAEQGVMIARVVEGGPAARGGLQGGSREVVWGNYRLLVGGDIIVEIDGVPIDGNAALLEFLETRTRVGQEVEVKFYRGNEARVAKVTLGERRS